MTTIQYYQHIEKLFLRLLNSLATVFRHSEIHEVQEFIDAGEYGLALETLMDIIHEEDKQIPLEAYKIISELAGMMEFSRAVIDKKLLGRVIDG